MVSLQLIVNIIFIIASLVAVFFLYKYLTSSSAQKPTVIVGNQIMATSPPPAITSIPTPYEGGDYTIAFWMYINSYNINRNSRKHILSIGGKNFSSVLIALGAFKNTLVVRTHSRDAGAGSYTPAPQPTDSFQDVSPTTPSTQGLTDGSLTSSDVSTLLQPLALDDGLLNTNSICDLQVIDLQRWVHVTVILSGRSIDVYLDGKLSRSCITGSYFKVDPTGVKVNLLSNGGFDGYLSKVQLLNTILNPSDIYQLYTAGP
jgi:hypothetical protein